jgi:8-oxo-dGTP diphosphatase
MSDHTPNPWSGRASRQLSRGNRGATAPPGAAPAAANEAVPGGTGTGDVRVDMRCSVLVMRGESVLLLGRVPAEHSLAQGLRDEIHHLIHADDEPGGQPAVWVLPGGRPQRGESMVACARREAREETGMRVNVGRCQFVLEVAESGGDRTVDLVFAASPMDPQEEPTQVEEGLVPQFVPLSQLRSLPLQPPIAGYVAGLSPERDRGAPYLGNLWRPNANGASAAGKRDER